MANNERLQAMKSEWKKHRIEEFAVEYDAVALGKWVPIFQDKVVFSSSEVRMFKENTRNSRNVVS